MKISISRDAILTPLQMVNNVIERRQTLPILSNVLISVKNNKLSLTGTDLEVEIINSCNIDNNEEGDTTLPAKKLLDICKALPENSQIEILIDQERAVLKSGRSRFTLSTLSATEFPSIDALISPFEFTIPQKTFKKLIDQTQFCMAQQDVRYYLNGLMFELSNNQMIAVATDGHRLAFCQAQVQLNPGETRQVIVPRKAVNEISRLLGDSDEEIKISLSENHIRITSSDIIFTSKLIDGKFPDYQQVIPKKCDNEVKSSRDNLYQAFHRTSVLSNEKYRGMRLQFSNNHLQATVHNPEQDEAEEVIEVTYSGDEFEIGFNVAYLLDALSAIKSDEVVMQLTDSNHSCLLFGTDDVDSKYVVMPMRL
ncbi:MAG: DNA polymerase III subunit beta [Gammaproteobacteria bacterium]|nr:DNA polymerase III subunit beta [Gammaproteobacteria bacterium]